MDDDIISFLCRFMTAFVSVLPAFLTLVIWDAFLVEGREVRFVSVYVEGWGGGLISLEIITYARLLAYIQEQCISG